MTTQRKPRHAEQTVSMVSPSGKTFEDVSRTIVDDLTTQGWRVVPGTVRTNLTH